MNYKIILSIAIFVAGNMLQASERGYLTETTPLATQRSSSWEFEIVNMDQTPIWVRIVDSWEFPEKVLLPKTRVAAMRDNEPGVLRMSKKKLPDLWGYDISIWNNGPDDAPFATYAIHPDENNAYVVWNNNQLKAQNGTKTRSGLTIQSTFTDNNIVSDRDSEDEEEDDFWPTIGEEHDGDVNFEN